MPRKLDGVLKNAVGVQGLGGANPSVFSHTRNRAGLHSLNPTLEAVVRK